MKIKRTLIDWNRFAELKNNSLSAAVKELTEAADYLADLVGVDAVRLISYDDGQCLYETTDGSFLQADFTVTPSKVVLENVERLVLDEDSEKENGKAVLTNMLEAIFDDKMADAQTLMDEYMLSDIAKRRRERSLQTEAAVLSEGKETRVRLYGTRGKGGRPKLFWRSGSKSPEKARAAKLGWARRRGHYRMGMAKRSAKLNQERSRRKKYNTYHTILRAKSGGRQYTGKRKRTMTECLRLADNVFGYLHMLEHGHVFGDSVINENNGALTITLPTAKKRNEGKIIMMQYDVLKTDLKVLREMARRLADDGRFCQLVADARRFNGMSDEKKLDESLQEIAKRFPNVLYLTHKELSESLVAALQSAGVRAFSDEVCSFLAEGILRNAHGLHGERVVRIMKLAKDAHGEDDYAKFQNAVDQVFPTLDESINLERKMFEDLYNATDEIRRLALEANNEAVKVDATNFMSDLEDVVRGRQPVSLELAAEVAGWLEELAETNLASEDWDVEKTPHRSVNGDHPQMAKNAKQPYSPSSDSTGDWGDPAPVSDGKSYKSGLADEMRGKSWGNIANKDTYPDVRNPYTPEPGKFTMPHDKGVDADDDNFGTWQDSDTWPNLQNPYIPKAMIPKQKIEPSNSVE